MDEQADDTRAVAVSEPPTDLANARAATVGQGDRVMIVGASGNVGPFAVQIAKSRGAHVTGVASGDKLDFVRSLGADEAIDYQTTDYARPAEPYDWILDVDAQRTPSTGVEIPSN